MFGSLRETLKQISRKNSTCVRFLETVPSLSSESKRSKSVGKTSSLAVSYLVNSCGLSPDKAIAASKLIDIKNTKRPDSVLELLRSHGFTRSHIAGLISRQPYVLLFHPERTLKPKIQFVESFGVVGADLAGLLSSDCRILESSLKKQTIPTCDFLRAFFEAIEVNPVKFLKLLSRVLRSNVQKVIVPNMSTLQVAGVPESHIQKLMRIYPVALLLRVDLFEEVVNEVKRIGFEPESNNFILAVGSFSVVSIAKKVNKKELLMSYGWSEEEFYAAVKVQPMLMGCSATKIKLLMDFFVNKVGLTPSDVARCPNVFLFSFQKRIVPRWLLLKALMSKGLVRKDASSVWAFNECRKLFEKKYVVRFEEDAPEVLQAYRDGMGFQESVADCKT